MDLSISEQKDSLRITKSSVGIGWEVKLFKEESETSEQLIARIKKAHLDLTKEFPNISKPIKH